MAPIKNKKLTIVDRSVISIQFVCGNNKRYTTSNHVRVLRFTCLRQIVSEVLQLFKMTISKFLLITYGFFLIFKNGYKLS